MAYEFDTIDKAPFHGWHAPRAIIDYPTLTDDVVVIAVWNGKQWPDGARTISYLTGRKNTLGLRYLWNHMDQNALQFQTKDQAYSWCVENDVVIGRDEVITIGELKARVGYPTGAWRRVSTTKASGGDR